MSKQVNSIMPQPQANKRKRSSPADTPKLYEEHSERHGPMPTPPVSPVEQSLIKMGAPEVLTMREAASFAKVSYGYVARMVREVKLVAYKPGKSYMIRREALADFITAKQAGKLEKNV